MVGVLLNPNTYDFVFDTTASAKFHLSFDKEEELPSDYTSQTLYVPDLKLQCKYTDCF